MAHLVVESGSSGSSSWDQHSHQLNQDELESLEVKAEQVSDLFSTAINSLAADVTALRHLTTWKEVIDNNAENHNDGVIDEQEREEFLQSLCDLDDQVAAVEKKVGILRQIVSEEQKALDNLNLLHKDSLEQNENLQYLVERCRAMKITNENANNNKKKNGLRRSSLSHNHHNNNNNNKSTKHHNPTKATTTTGSSKSSMRAPLGTHSTVNSAQSHEQHTHVEGLSCYFDPVTVEELESVPRTTRGRVQVHVINEALDNIEKCFHKKAVKEKRQQKLLDESRHVALARYQGVPEEQVDDEELLENLVVTEQELRQKCQFFLAGEGTARTVLAVLKALKRIKQMPQKKNGMFMYRLCLD